MIVPLNVFLALYHSILAKRQQQHCALHCVNWLIYMTLFLLSLNLVWVGWFTTGWTEEENIHHSSKRDESERVLSTISVKKQMALFHIHSSN